MSPRRLLIWLLSIGVAHAAPVSVTTIDSLSFGAIVAGSGGGTVTVSTAGVRSCAAGVTCLPQSAAKAAEYSISGDPVTSYVITLAAAATLSDGAGQMMTVDAFQSSSGGSGTLDSSGTGTFSVGATLHVGPGQPMGAYAGSFDVMVEYQ